MKACLLIIGTTVLMVLSPLIDPLSAQTVTWQKRYGGLYLESMIKMIKTSDGGYLAIGYTYQDVTNGFGKEDAFIIKIGSNFQTEWQRWYGGTENDAAADILEVESGYLFLAGSDSEISGNKTVSSKGSYDYWLLYLKKDGSIVWQSTYGGYNIDSPTAIIKASETEYLIGGKSNSNVSGDKNEDSKGRTDFWFVRVDNEGAIKWQKTIGGNHDDYLELMVPVEENKFFVAGVSYSKNRGDKESEQMGQGDIWALKLKENGDIEWQQSYGDEYRNTVSRLYFKDADKFFLMGANENKLCGSRQFDVGVYTINEKGNQEKLLKLFANKNDAFGSAIRTPDQGWLFALASHSDDGGHKSEPARGGSDIWFVRFDKDMHFMWDKSFGGRSDERAPKIFYLGNSEYLIGMNCSSDKSGDITEPWLGNGQDILFIKLKI